MTVNINLVKNMGKVNLYGLMVHHMKGIYLKMIYKEKELISGWMGESTKANGLLIKCTARDFFSGQMENNMRENISKAKRKDMENFNGVMVKYIKDNGKMECNMEKE